MRGCPRTAGFACAVDSLCAPSFRPERSAHYIGGAAVTSKAPKWLIALGFVGHTRLWGIFGLAQQGGCMAGKSQAVESGHQLRDEVADIGRGLGLLADIEVAVGRRIWGAKRRIDVVLKHAETRVSLGIECKFQGGRGSAEEKIPATIEDIRAWPIRGIVVYSGAGFTTNMESYLMSTGMAVALCDLPKWLELYFGL